MMELNPRSGPRTFRKAVQQNKIGTEHDIPHLSRQLIEKYVSDLRGQGLIPD
jgi:fatty acid CoA ligase FadD9